MEIVKFNCYYNTKITFLIDFRIMQQSIIEVLDTKDVIWVGHLLRSSEAIRHIGRHGSKLGCHNPI